MPTYEFEVLQTGERVEEYFPMREAPETGAVATLGDGRRARRLPSHIAGVKAFDPSHIAWQFRDHPDAPHQTADGFAAFSSMREIREFEAKNPRYRYDSSETGPAPQPKPARRSSTRTRAA